MTGKLYQRIATGICALIIVATGVFAPLSFAVPGITTGQGIVQVNTAHADEPDSFKGICGDALLSLNGEQIACSIVLWLSKGAFTVTGFLAGVSGRLFDYMLWFTIQSSTYADSDFIETGWGILRDFANIVFIVALIIAALNIMLSGVVTIGGRDGKKMLASVIVAALLVNFSLFFASVIVDASHILARTFYNRITTDTIDPTDALNSSGNGGVALETSDGETPISVALIDQIDPQALVGDSEILTYGTFGWATIVVVYAFMTIIHLVLIFVFLSMSLMFVGRTVALMFGMIIAPFSFATLGTPMDSLPYVGFKTWMKDLAKNAFMVPVFLFFLYLTVLFMGETLTTIKGTLGDSYTKTLGQKMIDIVIPMSLIVGLLLGGKKAAGKMASEIASQANAIVGKGVGMLAGSALTVGAGALTIGAGAAAGGLGKLSGSLLKGGEKYSRSGKFGSKILGGAATKFGSGIGSMSDKVKNAKTDVRSSFLGGQAMNALGTAGFSGMGVGGSMFTSAKAREDEKSKAVAERTERNQKFMNQEEEKAKAIEDEKIVSAQAENDNIMNSDAYKDQAKRQQDSIDDLGAEIKDEKKQLGTLKDAYAAEVAANPKNPDHPDIKKARQEVKDKEGGLKDLATREKKMKEDLDSGAFYKGANTAEVQVFNTEMKTLSEAEELARDSRIRDRKIADIQGKPTAQRTREEQRDLTTLVVARNTDRAAGDSTEALEERVRFQEEAMDSSGNSALRLRANRGKIKESEKVQEELDSKINLNNRRAIKQELDLMNNAVANISSSIIAGITGGALGVAAMAATGGALGISGTGAAIGGAATGLSLWGGGSAAVKTGSDKLGFNEKDRKQLRDLFRKTTKKEDK